METVNRACAGMQGESEKGKTRNGKIVFEREVRGKRKMGRTQKRKEKEQMGFQMAHFLRETESLALRR